VNARDQNWREGQRVRFVREYNLALPPEYATTPALLPGTLGRIVKKFDDRVWVEVDGLADPATIWFETDGVEASASTATIEDAG
jgi:hypothetical protein